MHHEKITRVFAVPCPLQLPRSLLSLSLTVPVSEPPTCPRAGDSGLWARPSPALSSSLRAGEAMGIGKETRSPGCPEIPLLFCPTQFGGVSLNQISIWWLCFHESQRRWLRGCRTQTSPFISNTVKTSSFMYDPIIPAMKLSVWFSLESGAPYL